MRRDRTEPGTLRAHGAQDPPAPGLAAARVAVLEESSAAGQALREELEGTQLATRSLQDAAASLVAEHGRVLVRLERETAARRGMMPAVEPARDPADDVPIAGPQQPAGGEGGLVRKTGVSLAAQLSTAAITSVLALFLIRALGPADFGVFSLALAITGLLLQPADFGISSSAARFIAEARGNSKAISAIFADALRLKLGITSLTGLLIVLLAPLAARVFDSPQLVTPLRIVAIALVGQSLMLLFTTTFLAVGRVGYNLRLLSSESAVELTATVTLILLGGGAVGAASGRAIGYGFGALFGAALASRAFGREALRPGLRVRHEYRRLVRYAGALFLVGAFTVFNQIDVLLIGRLLGSASVGLFAAPMRLCTVLHYPGLAVSNAISPRLARSIEAEPDTRSFTIGLQTLIVLQVAIAVPILIWATPIVALLLGPKYAAAAPVLRALTPFVVMQGIGPLISVSVNYLGQARRRVPIAVGSVLVNIVLDVVLIPRIGVIGAAIGTDVAYAIYIPAHFLICRRVLGLDARPIVVTCLRSLAAGAAMAVPLLLAGTESLNAIQWIVGGAAGLAAYVAALLVTGEVSWAMVRSFAGRLRPRAAQPRLTGRSDIRPGRVACRRGGPMAGVSACPGPPTSHP